VDIDKVKQNLEAIYWWAL